MLYSYLLDKQLANTLLLPFFWLNLLYISTTCENMLDLIILKDRRGLYSDLQKSVPVKLARLLP